MPETTETAESATNREARELAKLLEDLLPKVHQAVANADDDI